MQDHYQNNKKVANQDFVKISKDLFQKYCSMDLAFVIDGTGSMDDNIGFSAE